MERDIISVSRRYGRRFHVFNLFSIHVYNCTIQYAVKVYSIVGLVGINPKESASHAKNKYKKIYLFSKLDWRATSGACWFGVPSQR